MSTDNGLSNFLVQFRTLLLGTSRKAGGLMPRRHRLVRLAAVLLVIFVGVFSALFVVKPQPVRATITDLGYPWASVPAVPGGTYEWGFTTCPDNDSGCMQLKDSGTDGKLYGISDPYGYALRNCTSFVAWKLVSLGVPVAKVRSLGNGGDWYDNAPNNGLSRDTTPQVGDAAVIPSTTPGFKPYGHVAYVDKVNSDGTIEIQQSNWDLIGDQDQRTVNPTQVGFTEFVHFGSLMTNSNGSGSLDSDGYFHGTPPNGAVIENHDGGLHKYVALGGSLFWIPEDGSVWDYVNQMQTLFPTGTFHNIVWMHDSDIHNIEFGYPSGGREHPPGDNSFFYERGSPTQYVVQYGFSFSIGSANEVTYLGGQNKAIMVPATNIAGRLAGVPSIPNDVLLQAYGNPAIYHEVNGTAFWADNTTVVDCVITAKHGAIQPVPASLMSSLWNAGRMSSNVTHCSFPPNWALYGPGGAERWWVDGANPYTRHLYVNPLALRCRLGSVPTEVQLPDAAGINSPVQGSDLDCPNGSLVRITSTGEVFQVWSSILHYVPWQATLSCLTGGHPELVIDIDAAVVATTPRGDWAQCSLEGKLIQSPGGSVDYIVNGARHHILTWAVVNCLKGRRGTGDPVVVDQSTFDSYPDSGVYAYCPSLVSTLCRNKARISSGWWGLQQGRLAANAMLARCVSPIPIQPPLKRRMSLWCQ